MQLTETLTAEQKLIFNVQHRKAMEHFGIKHGDHLVLHHKDPNLQYRDFDRYISWNPEDLVVMTPSEHNRLHMQLNPKARHTTPHTEATKQLLSKKFKGGTHKGKPVICVETGQVFEKQRDACKAVGVSPPTLNRVLNGGRKTCGGYHWKYYTQ